MNRMRAFPQDPALPEAGRLLGPEGTRALGSFLAKSGWALEEARPVQATYRPGRSCLVRYRARATGPAGARVLSLCAETTTGTPRIVTPPDDFGTRFGIAEPVAHVAPYLVWAYPYDPSLRQLPDAAWGPAVRDRIGVSVDAVSVQPLRYRPRRRAVFRYRMRHRRDGWRTSFGKVIPSLKAGRALAASARLHAAGRPVTLPTTTSRQLMVLPEVQGRSLRDILLRGGSLPAPGRLANLVTDLAGTAPGDLDWTRPETTVIAGTASELLLGLLPELGSEIARVRDAAGSIDARSAPRLVHGDLYEAQILVGRGYRLELIDLDDVALGDPAMDAANVCAHLLVLALAVPPAADRLVAYRELVRRAFLDRLGVSSSELALREALCVLQLATGPFRVLDPSWPEQVGRRVNLAVRLLEDG